MQHEHYAQLLFDAIRETLETMAFAEVVPYSIKIGDQELVDPEKLNATVRIKPESPGGDAWGVTPSPVTDGMWANPLDAWSGADVSGSDENEILKTEKVDFARLMNDQKDWCWACLKVNSPDLDSIWLIVSKQLTLELARTMYADESFQMDSPILSDIIAELTNVLGGRLMLLLEEIVGRFTLEVPVTGTGQPELPDNMEFETVMCKVFVDGLYPVISVMCFKNREAQEKPVAMLHAEAE